MQAQTTTIHLDVLSPTRSCGLPGIFNGPLIPAWPCSWWGLQADPVTRVAGGLLHHRFTLACVRGPSAVWFLLHFPSGYPAWELPSTIALWSPDFPHLRQSGAAAVRQTRMLILRRFRPAASPQEAAEPCKEARQECHPYHG